MRGLGALWLAGLLLLLSAGEGARGQGEEGGCDDACNIAFSYQNMEIKRADALKQLRALVRKDPEGTRWLVEVLAQEDLDTSKEELAEARTLAEGLAKKNDIMGIVIAGEFAWVGQGGPQDYAAAERMFAQAAAEGSKNKEKMDSSERAYRAHALRRLGDRYYFGRGTATDYDKARKYYEQASAEYDPFATYMLGETSYNGEGTVKNLEEAATWYRRASEMKVQGALYSLGFMSVYGQDGPTNLDAGVALLRQTVHVTDFPDSRPWWLGRADAIAHGKRWRDAAEKELAEICAKTRHEGACLPVVHAEGD